MKPNKNNISKLLDKTQQEYELLFQSLILLKNFKSKDFQPKLIINFQYNLGTSLYVLTKARVEIVAYEKLLIGRKGILNQKWFKMKMGSLKKLKNALDDIIQIGKSLGDAFVWHFYQFNLKELFRNLEHDEIKLPPIGIGGIGELEFIKRHFYFQDNIVILHGISNSLRVGDVSFISMKDFKLVAIGEIKTKMIDNEQLGIHISFIGVPGRDIVVPKDIEIPKVSETDLYNSYFDPERFKRQIQKIRKYVKPLEPLKEDGVIFDNYHIKELEEVVESVSSSRMTIKKADKNLLYIAHKLPLSRFSDRIDAKLNQSKYKKQEKEIEDLILSIIDKTGPNHHLQFGSIHFDKKGKLKSLIGTGPLFWYPIKPSVLKEIYFQRVFAFTIFNPTQFLNDLKSLGLGLNKDEQSGKLFFEKPLEVGKLRFEYFNYFFDLIKDHLHTQTAVLKAVGDIISKAESYKDLEKTVKIQAELFHLFTSYNEDKI